MALGGGTFLTQNKVVPGSYINFISAARASAAISDRGIVTIPLIMDWGPDEEIFEVETGDFQKDSMKIFGYDYTSAKVKEIREVFLHAKKAYFFRLNSGEKASNAYGTAKYTGIRGNDLKTVISKNIDDDSMYDVVTYLGTAKIDVQTVSSAADLKETDYVIPKKEAELEETAGMPFTGGTNLEEITGAEHQAYLDKIESYSFHTMACPSADKTTKALYVAFTKRMREEAGVKFQTVVYNMAADYEGIINVKNKITDESFPEYSLVYWVAGASAGCAVNKSNTNQLYDGEFMVNTSLKQSQLEAGIKAGEFIFHRSGDEIRVLSDVNSFVSFTADKNEDFSYNQVVRVLDQIANDIAVLFNTRYIGKVQNNEAGRIAFWSDIVTYNKELETLQAIENFSSADVTVEKGSDKKSVTVSNAVTPVCAMEKLYMTVVVS